MSITLGLHNTNQIRVFKLNNSNTAVEDAKAFIKDKIALVIFGTFDGETDLIEAANKMCLESSHNQAVLWIKNSSLIEKVSIALNVDAKKMLAVSFKRNTTKVAHSIQRNPSNSLFKISPPEMSFAFGAALKVNGPLS